MICHLYKYPETYLIPTTVPHSATTSITYHDQNCVTSAGLVRPGPVGLRPEPLLIISSLSCTIYTLVHLVSIVFSISGQDVQLSEFIKNPVLPSYEFCLNLSPWRKNAISNFVYSASVRQLITRLHRKVSSNLFHGGELRRTSNLYC
jgi:hypothetical protein